MAKKKRSWKKKLGKALMAGAALAGGLALAKRARGTSSPFLASGAAGGARLPKGDAHARAKRLMTSNDAYSDQTMPAHLSHTMGNTGPARQWTGDQTMAPNRSIWRAKGGSAYKSGGRVTGIAKRGFGRALKKGKK